jgi:hypothetical protein
VAVRRYTQPSALRQLMEFSGILAYGVYYKSLVALTLAPLASLAQCVFLLTGLNSLPNLVRIVILLTAYYLYRRLRANSVSLIRLLLKRDGLI